VKYFIICLIFLLNVPGILIGLFCGVCLYLISKVTKDTMLNKYAFNVLITFDQAVNTICGGDVDETISSRMGKWAKNGKNRHGIRKPLFIFANWIVEKFEKNHFASASEDDEGKNKLLD
jgi:hypothetical protein